MNKAITDGLALMPPPFSNGLNAWSREDGTPGTTSYAGAADAAQVPSDQDFGGCLELQKTEATQRLRYKGETPFEPGLYLQVTVRIKAVAGPLPTVRIAARPSLANGNLVTGVTATGPATDLSDYGEVVTLRAIIGSGNRQGVAMVWGTSPAYFHIGLDLTGPNGGVVRIDDIEVEDVTSYYHTQMLGLVDVRDYGAVGNGTTNDAAAFEAADAAADGRTVLVPEGVFRLNSNVTFENPVRFEGTVSMPANARLSCTRNFELDTYAAAFGSELEGFRRGLQVLFNFTDHVSFDLRGRRVDVNAPIDVAALAGINSFAQRRLLTNGQLNAVANAAWNTDTVTVTGTYATNDPNRITGLANVANIPVGAQVTGTGVGREVYVKERNVAAGTVTLSRPLWGAAGTRPFTFRRYQYMLDFSGFADLQKFEITDMELLCNGLCSAIMLPVQGLTFRLADSVINRPRDRGISSIGTGCQGILIDQNQFLSNEQAMPSQNRTTIAMNVNANDAKIRDNRIVRFAHFAVIGGSGNMLIGNHFFQGDDQTDGIRQAGVVFTLTNLKTLMTGNYIDNSFIEWSNEHDPAPGFNNEFSFGGLTISDNIFTANDVAASFRWLVVKPRGPGHFLNGLAVTGNAFRTINGQIDRIEKVDTTNANLDFGKFRNVVFENNTFNGINQITASPVVVNHAQNTADASWTVNGADYLPFNGWARAVTAIVAEGAITSAAGTDRHDMPHVQVEQGAGNDRVNLRWPVPVRGRVLVTVRCDNPS
ncbi:right-handed parallel beta-helix repeat-containing protein [Aliigemmobacter aestuarii]|uniref:Right-handed parallel beta-helix repeat-containing protein n=1 Tax=Aliigemmobacter aestuarii TaxID=1445661 RepID=A0A4S3MRB1_9RHOB|nr:glycosyl hydrolase family 28-related protein [Gemmobacter aestuarii]THD85056.1 right-handed parallel beta-helix repeat-containing protein [Gemmobacter aestuarii]